MKARAAAAFRAGVGAVALALAVTVAAPVSAEASLTAVKPSAGAHKKAAPKVFRSLKVTPARPVVGSEVTVRGRTKAAERRVVLQVRGNRGGWRKVAARRTTRTGKFSFKYAVSSVEPRSLRVVARTAPEMKRTARHVGRGKSAKTHRKLKSRRVVSKTVKVVVRPAPVVRTPVETPTPDPVDVFAAELRGAVDAGVRDYRTANNVVSPVATNQCLSRWADGFAATMARTNLFAHSVSSEWEGSIVSNSAACLGVAPALIRQEAIAWETGATPQEVADKVLRAWKDAWMHDEVLLDDFGHDRVLSVGVAKGDAAHGWYVVAVFGADF